MSLFNETDLFELRSAAYPGEWLVACRNPLLTEEMAGKRESRLKATEGEVEKVAAATRRAVRRDMIGLRVGKAWARRSSQALSAGDR